MSTGLHVTAMNFVYALALYLALGCCVGAAFVTIGAGRVLPYPTPFTPTTRLLLFPGAAALWPYVLIRWLRAAKSA